jgi:hypothetical protein
VPQYFCNRKPAWRVHWTFEKTRDESLGVNDVVVTSNIGKKALPSVKKSGVKQGKEPYYLGKRALL